MSLYRAMLVLVAWLAAAPSWAHKPSDSYLRISRDAGQLKIQWDIALKDLEYVVGLDADRNGEITWGELKVQRDTIARHALDRLQISAGTLTCELRLKQMKATRHSDGGYAVLILDGDSPTAEALTVQYSLLFDVDPTHRGLVLYAEGDATSTHVLSVDAPSAALRASGAALLPQFLAFVRTGVWHILIGFDHILFLATLLLPAVLGAEGGAGAP